MSTNLTPTGHQRTATYWSMPHYGGDQTSPVVANFAGGFIVVWTNQGQDGDGFGIYAQRYTSAGVTDGAAFKMNEFTAGDQSAPTVAMDNAGNFIIAWQSLGQDGDGYGVYARQYDNTGTPQTVNEFLVNTTTDGNQIAPTVAAARDVSHFVIAWQSEVIVEGEEEEEETAVEIFVHMYDSDGSTIKAEFQVNSDSEKEQVDPSVAMDADGAFVVAWTTEGLQGSGADVFARRFDAVGTGLGDDFKVNVTTGQGQESPSVSIDGDGDFLITWQSSHQDGFSWGIFGQAYDSDGNIIAGEFQVNSNTQGPQILPMTNANSDGTAIVVWLGLDATHHPAIHAQRYLLPQPLTEFAEGPEGEVVLANYVSLEEAPAATAVDANRNFVTVWQSYGEDGSGLGVFGRQFDADGNPKDFAFQVNTTTDGNQSNPHVASDADGNFVVVWQAIDQDGYGVFARRYASDGTPLSGEFQINSTTAGDQTHPTIAMNPTDGSFVVFWQGSDAELTGIYMQRFEADGDPIDGEQLVNTFTDLGQYSARAAMNASGEFVVAWVSDHRAVFDPDDTEKSIFVQWFDADGNSTGDEVLIHEIRAEYEAQEYPDVAIDADGNFIVVWQSINQDGNTWGVFGRQFLADKTPVQDEFQINQTISPILPA